MFLFWNLPVKALPWQSDFPKPMQPAQKDFKANVYKAYWNAHAKSVWLSANLFSGANPRLVKSSWVAGDPEHLSVHIIIWLKYLKFFFDISKIHF